MSLEIVHQMQTLCKGVHIHNYTHTLCTHTHTHTQQVVVVPVQKCVLALLLQISPPPFFLAGNVGE